VLIIITNLILKTILSSKLISKGQTHDNEVEKIILINFIKVKMSIQQQINKLIEIKLKMGNLI